MKRCAGGDHAQVNTLRLIVLPEFFDINTEAFSWAALRHGCRVDLPLASFFSVNSISLLATLLLLT